MVIGSRCTLREFCDGQSLASPGRWEPHARRFPESSCWKRVDFVHRVGTTSLLMELALGRVEKSPFKEEEVLALKEAVLREPRTFGHSLKTSPTDRKDVPIDFRFLELLLELAEDPEVAIGSFPGGVRVGPGVRMPRLPALYKPRVEKELLDLGRALRTGDSCGGRPSRARPGVEVI